MTFPKYYADIIRPKLGQTANNQNWQQITKILYMMYIVLIIQFQIRDKYLFNTITDPYGVPDI